MGCGLGLLRVEKDSPDPAPPWWWLVVDAIVLVETVVGSVVGLIALFSSYDHVSLPGQVLPIQQQWGVWLIAVFLPLVFI
jgi:hypothetical protein